MNWLKFTIWTYLVFAVHSVVASSLAVAGYAPHLVLAGLILMTSRMAGRQGLLAAGLWGLLADCLTEGRLGAGIVCFSLSTWLLQRCTGRRISSVPWRIAVFSVPLIGADIVAELRAAGFLVGRFQRALRLK